MVGTYIEYYNNIYEVIGFNSSSECVKVKLVKQSRYHSLCENEDHSDWLAQGEMWPKKFFEEAKVISKEKFDLFYKDQ